MGGGAEVGGVGGRGREEPEYPGKKIPDSQPENRYYIIIHKDRTFSL